MLEVCRYILPLRASHKRVPHQYRKSQCLGYFYKDIGSPRTSIRIRGQAYVGASVMSDEVGGVQAKIKEISPLAIYTPAIHILSIFLYLHHARLKMFISLTNESYLFLSNSPKWQRLFGLTINKFLPHARANILPGLCKTTLDREAYML